MFSTFEAGRVCGVVHTTVINWVNKGLLKAHTTPGGHRRIALQDLVEFMQRFEMPIPPDLAGRRRRILIVEDDAMVQRMLRRALAALEDDVEVDACAGGLEALMKIGKEAPDLLVLDIRIPQVNGFEVLKLLRGSEQTKPIRIIVVTGEALSRENEAGVREQADELLRKPIDVPEFRRRAAELLGLEAPVPSGS